MDERARKTCLILGGAGFLGSRIAHRFHAENFAVTVLDGLKPDTGGDVRSLRGILPDIRVVEEDVASFPELAALVHASDVVVDSIGWTRHWMALENPLQDLEWNVASHLHVLRHLGKRPGQKTIYLASRGQYGATRVPVIDEETPMVPHDVQGIHKLTAENHFRFFSQSKTGGFPAISLRLPNCFGPSQPVAGDDIGLVGSLIRDLAQGKQVEIYGEGRIRQLVYSEDLAALVHQLALSEWSGFAAYNYCGWEMPIDVFAAHLARVIGSGSRVVKPMPEHVAKLDVGNGHLSDEKLRRLFPRLPQTDLDEALRVTVHDFKERS